MHINLDDFLDTGSGRIWTPERNAEAWRQSFAALATAMRQATGKTTLYVLIGAQASGKSTWARQKAAEDPHAVLFDAILVKKSERLPILKSAGAARVPVVAVWLKTTLEVCVARNAARSQNEICDEGGLKNVFAALEPPTFEEGFARILEIC